MKCVVNSQGNALTISRNSLNRWLLMGITIKFLSEASYQKQNIPKSIGKQISQKIDAISTIQLTIAWLPKGNYYVSWNLKHKTVIKKYKNLSNPV